METLISLAECQEVVQNCGVGPFRLLNYTVTPFGDDVVGFLGEYFKLAVEIEQNDSKCQTLSFFVKSMPMGDPEYRRIMEREGMFGKEVDIYQKLFSQWPQVGVDFEPDFKWRPDCYYTRNDLLVMERLGEDYKHAQAAFDMHHCREMLRAQAKLHASSLHFERRTGEKLSESFGHLWFEVPLKEGNTWFAAGLEVIHNVTQNYPQYFQELNVPEKPVFMDKLQGIFRYRNEVTDFEKVMCHMDMWYSNILFRYSEKENIPEHGVLLDFQIADYRSPVMDIMISLHTTTRREFRRDHLSECFSFYKTALRDILKNNFKFTEQDIGELNFLKDEEFERAQQHYKLYAYVINCIFTPLIQLKPGTIMNLKRTDPEKYFQVTTINRNKFTEENMEADPNYKSYVLEVVHELVEFLFGQRSALVAESQ